VLVGILMLAWMLLLLLLDWHWQRLRRGMWLRAGVTVHWFLVDVSPLGRVGEEEERHCGLLVLLQPPAQPLTRGEKDKSVVVREDFGSKNKKKSSPLSLEGVRFSYNKALGLALLCRNASGFGWWCISQ
jgi:hypothetical protein